MTIFGLHRNFPCALMTNRHDARTRCSGSRNSADLNCVGGHDRRVNQRLPCAPESNKMSSTICPMTSPRIRRNAWSKLAPQTLCALMWACPECPLAFWLRSVLPTPDGTCLCGLFTLGRHTGAHNREGISSRKPGGVTSISS